MQIDLTHRRRFTWLPVRLWRIGDLHAEPIPGVRGLWWLRNVNETLTVLGDWIAWDALTLLGDEIAKLGEKRAESAAASAAAQSELNEELIQLIKTWDCTLDCGASSDPNETLHQLAPHIGNIRAMLAAKAKSTG